MGNIYWGPEPESPQEGPPPTPPTTSDIQAQWEERLKELEIERMKAEAALNQSNKELLMAQAGFGQEDPKYLSFGLGDTETEISPLMFGLAAGAVYWFFFRKRRK